MPAWELPLFHQQSSDSIVKRSWHFAHCQVTVFISSSHNRPNLFLLPLINPEIPRSVSHARGPALPCSPNQNDFSGLVGRKKGEIFQLWEAAHFSLTDCNLQCCPHSSDRKTVSPDPEYGTPKQCGYWDPQQDPVRAMETHHDPLEDLGEKRKPSFTLHVNYNQCANIFCAEVHLPQWEFLCVIYVLGSHQQHLLLSCCWAYSEATGAPDSKLFLTQLFNLCISQQSRLEKGSHALSARIWEVHMF